MELINQHTKKIMEGCKERARTAGLRFEDETLEYIVTNRDLLELTPKAMIPTLYDYWVHDVEVLREKGKYELYPHNPYETVINTRPAISFYNDNNPDWLNVMIFYHVLAHIDFFQKNLYFKETWEDDFAGQALSDKRLISKLRSDKGRWVDYIIEFSRSIDNLVGFHKSLSQITYRPSDSLSKRLNYYFDVFLQNVKDVKGNEYIKEIERYNSCTQDGKTLGERVFFAEVGKKYPEFDNLYQKYVKDKKNGYHDLLQYILSRSEVLNKDENKWMKSIVEVVRKTSLFFQPQIRTKIMNEGWASYWHEVLFLQDDRINGHEVDFARVDAKVTSLPRVGLNPYALGKRMFSEIEEKSDKGKYSFEFHNLLDAESRKTFDASTGNGKDYIFKVRENFCDFMFINTFVDQDFINRYKLFVAGKRINPEKRVWEYYVWSRKAEDYRQMLLDSLYHPPHIQVDPEKNGENTLYLVHTFEEKPLVKEFIANTLLGIEYLWGGPVQLETSEVESVSESNGVPYGVGYIPAGPKERTQKEISWQRVIYTMKNRELKRQVQ